MTYQRVNPYDGKVLQTFEEITDKQLERALATAANCFETWRRKTFAERAVVVPKGSTIMHARVDEFARPVCSKWGSSWARSRESVARAARLIEIKGTPNRPA
jgi:succinate-semialdehyde dehydrogenase/glutarate-semialdehyde dehydrogenase